MQTEKLHIGHKNIIVGDDGDDGEHQDGPPVLLKPGLAGDLRNQHFGLQFPELVIRLGGRNGQVKEFLFDLGLFFRRWLAGNQAFDLVGQFADAGNGLTHIHIDSRKFHRHTPFSMASTARRSACKL